MHGAPGYRSYCTRPRVFRRSWRPNWPRIDDDDDVDDVDDDVDDVDVEFTRDRRALSDPWRPEV